MPLDFGLFHFLKRWWVCSFHHPLEQKNQEADIPFLSLRKWAPWSAFRIPCKQGIQHRLLQSGSLALRVGERLLLGTSIVTRGLFKERD